MALNENETKCENKFANNCEKENCLMTPPATDASKKTVSGTSVRADLSSSEANNIDSSGDYESNDHNNTDSAVDLSMSNVIKSVLSKMSINEISELLPPKTLKNPFEGGCRQPDIKPTYSSAGDIQRKFKSSSRVTLCETLYVPVKKYPKYNFVGRILGPRGMTVKQLEKETGCKIFVRGRASSTAFNPHTKMMRGGVISNKSSLSTISQGALTDEPLHVYIEVCDFEPSASKKLKLAVEIINSLLSPPADGKDELKRQQLVDISLINGTYRPTSVSYKNHRTNRYGNYTTDPTSMPADALDDVNCSDDYSPVANQNKKNFPYKIIEQKKAWNQNASIDEFVNSASSREYVSDMVYKTRQASRGILNDNSHLENNEDDLPQNRTQSISPATVSESLKVAQNLIQSHNEIPIGVIGKPSFQNVPNTGAIQHQTDSYGSIALNTSVGSIQAPPPPPPFPIMPPFIVDQEGRPCFYPPPPPILAPQANILASSFLDFMGNGQVMTAIPPRIEATSPMFPIPGFFYMLSSNYPNNSNDSSSVQ